MRILVYGAGPLGTLFAARLYQSGEHDVTILARGQRLEEIRRYGVVVHDVTTDRTVTARVPAVDELAPEDAYDLVLVIMRKNAALQILPVLASNTHTPNILFLMNNATGPEALIQALGRERVLIGFPNSAGYHEGHIVHVLSGTEGDEAKVPFGEVDGNINERTRTVAAVLESAPGLGAEIRTDMDIWLKYHVALLMPSIAPALYATGTDHLRMARTRDALILAVRAVREGFRVLQALGYPITPARFRIFMWLPEPLLVAFLRRLMSDPRMKIALEGHAAAARDEIRHLKNEFLELAAQTSVPIPTIRRLTRYFDLNAPLIADGSDKLPLRWHGVAAATAAVAGVVLGAIALTQRRRGLRRRRVGSRYASAPDRDLD